MRSLRLRDRDHDTALSAHFMTFPALDGETEPDLFLSPENIDFYATNLYDAFRVRDQEIRLLQPLPGSWADEIRCEFAGIARLDNQVRQYEALSYSAGDVNDTRSIRVNGHNFNVFASIFGAL